MTNKCEECGKEFVAKEEIETLCPDCWKKIVFGEGLDK